jgi:hypothetical protein
VPNPPRLVKRGRRTAEPRIRVFACVCLIFADSSTAVLPRNRDTLSDWPVRLADSALRIAVGDSLLTALYGWRRFPDPTQRLTHCLISS